MGTEKEMTAPISSVGADEEQPNAKSNAIIAEFDEKCNISDESFEEMQRELIYSQNPFYLKTVQMNKLYDTVYQSKPPKGSDIQPNTLTLKLNVNAGRLLNDYGIRYLSKRTHDGRRVSLMLEEKH